MIRRRQLQAVVGPLLDIYGADLGADIVAALGSVADLLDEHDDLIGCQLDVTAEEDRGDSRWQLPDVG